MAAGDRNGIDRLGPQFLGKSAEFARRQSTKVGGNLDLIEK
jgi:hypothetical protein